MIAERITAQQTSAASPFIGYESGIDRLLQAWALEFARAFAVSLGEYPFVSCGRARHLAAVDVSNVLWWRATVEGACSFPMWVGACEKTWSTVGKLNWLRLLEGVQASAIANLNTELACNVRAGQAQLVQPAPDRETLCYALMGIKLSRTELPALLFAIDPTAREELTLKNSIQSVAHSVPECLLDLELPLSVALGRAKLPIGEVLKITSGSVIHLHGHTGDEVEVLVHGTVVARGQVVSHKGNYAVRIQQIISASDRLKLAHPEPL